MILNKFYSLSILYFLITFFIFAQDNLIESSKHYKLEDIADKIIKDELRPLLYEYSEDTISNNLTPIALIDTNEFYVRFKGGGVEIMINSEKFIPQLHVPLKNIYSSDSLRKIHNLFEIDGEGFWGTHGEVPLTKIKKLIISINNKKIHTPDSATHALYEPNFGCYNKECHNFVYHSLDRRRVYLKMKNGDGAGYYEVIWIIKDNKYYGKVIGFGP